MADFLIVLGAITLMLLIGVPASFIGAWIAIWLSKLGDRLMEMLGR
ncbi:hypothetical protein [Nocardia abscessus]|nr:hypothetical protein [Nocardia abscessus]